MDALTLVTGYQLTVVDNGPSSVLVGDDGAHYQELLSMQPEQMLLLGQMLVHRSNQIITERAAA